MVDKNAKQDVINNNVNVLNVKLVKINILCNDFNLFVDIVM